VAPHRVLVVPCTRQGPFRARVGAADGTTGDLPLAGDSFDQAVLSANAAGHRVGGCAADVRPGTDVMSVTIEQTLAEQTAPSGISAD
jgi:hypothetical protein